MSRVYFRRIVSPTFTGFRYRSLGLNALSTLLAALVLAIAATAAITATSEPLPSIPNPRVRDGTWVTDMPSALRAETVAQVNAWIGEFERTTGGEMAVVVISSLDGLSVEEAAEKLFNLWGIGKKGSDNGLLFLWSTGDRRVRLEVGYGFEGVLPDGKVGAILDTYVIPKFKLGQFDEGVLAGVDAFLKGARNEEVRLPSARTQGYEIDGTTLRRVWYGLLGIVPTGLASIVGFRKWRRYRRRRCQQCGTRMQRLSETEDDAHISEGQQMEERVGSVDYDAWKCPSCSHHFVLRYPAWLSKYAKCPQCHNRTKSSAETVITAATTSSSGRAKVVETCAFCNYRNEFTKTLPRIQRSSSSGSSGGGSSSSFGGGSSGGGGASRSY
jgi:uncharacterized protein